MSELYRDFIDNEMDDIITALNGTITPTPVNSELYRNFLNRKADDIITALNGTITPAPIGDELYRDFIERKFDDVISGIGSYIPPVSFPTVSGAVCSFDSQYAGLPLKSHSVAVTGYQSGSGTPSPSNPRALNGWSAIGISATGCNLWGFGDVSGTRNRSIIVSPNVPTGSYVISGVLTTTDTDTDTSLILVYLKSGTQRAIRVPRNTRFSATISATSPITQINFYGGYDYDQSAGDVFTYSDIQIELGNTATDYQPFGTYTTIQIGSTIYGGNYDAVSGVLTADVKGILARDVTGWAKSGNVYYRNFPDVYTTVTPDTPTGRKPLICSHFDYSSSSIIADLKIGYGGANNNGNIVIRYDALSTISDFNDYITNNDVFIVYPLATPQTIQLPPCRVETQAGVNNVFADTGDTTLQYIKIGGNT